MAAAVGPIVGAAIGGVGSIAGGKEMADAQRYAAQRQAESAAEALKYQKGQAAQDLASAQAASQGNYNQWAAREGRLSDLGQSIGLKPFNIPAYVPIPTVNQAPTGPPPPMKQDYLTTMPALTSGA